MKKNASLAMGLPYLILLGVVLLLLLPFAHPWFPQTVDGEYYTARLANYIIALKEASIPPRLAPTFYSGLSYPVLNFNYPLPNILGSFFVALGFSLQSSMKSLVIGSYISGGFGVYYLLKKILNSNFASLIGSLLYITAPYQLFNVFHRLSIGEICMFGLLPWIGVTLISVGKNKLSPKIAAFIYAGFFLTHNLFTLVSLPFLVLLSSIYLDKKMIKKNSGALLSGLLMSLFFWVPAIGEMKYTILPTASINNSFANELLSLKQALKLPGWFQETLPATSNTDQPGYAQVGVLLITAALLLRKKALNFLQNPSLVPAIIIAMTTGLGALFMVTTHSGIVWQAMPFLRFLQHPTRLYFLLVCATAFLGAVLVQNRKWRWLLSATLLILTIINYANFDYKPKYFIPFEDDFFYSYPLTSAAGNEFDPIWYDRLKTEAFLTDHTEKIITVEPVEITKYISRNFSKKYTIEAKNPTSVVERTLFFPGWETKVDGQLIDTKATAYRYFGLVNYDIGSGKHEVETTWTQNTHYRQWGNIGSIIGLIGVFVLKNKAKA